MSSEHGDQLLASIRARPDMKEVFELAGTDAWESRIVTLAPPERELVLVAVQALSATYRDQDRNLAEALRWANTHVRLARALPTSFGPSSSRVGYGRDHYLYAALSGLAQLEGMNGAVEREYDLLLEALDRYQAEQDRRRSEQVVERPAAERILGISGGPEHLYQSLAHAAWRIGDEAEARRWHLLSVDHSETATTDGEVHELMLRGEYWLDMQQPDNALASFEAALALATTEGVHPHMAATTAYAYCGMADAYRRLGLPRGALDMVNEARSLMADSDKSGFLARIERTAAEILCANPRLGDALRHFLLALEYLSAPAGPEVLHTWTTADGRVLRLVDFESALDILLGVAGLLRDTGRCAEARGFLQLAAANAESIRSGAIDEKTRIAVQEKHSQALITLATIDLELDHPDDAWQTVETLRARTFLDMVGEERLVASAGVPADLVARERDLLDRRRRLRASPGRGTGFWTAHEAIQAELAAVWRAMIPFSPEAEQYVAVRQARPATRAEVSSALSGGRAVAVNLLFPDDETLVFLAVGAGDTQVRVASSRVDRRRLDRFTAANFGADSKVRQLALDLEDLFHHEFRDVVAPLADLCEPGDTLVVAPTGPIHHVPLGAVQLGGDVLFARNPVVISPSASLIRSRALAPRRSGLGTTAVFGDPTGDLAGARQEAIEQAGQCNVRPCLGADATAGALLAALGSVETVHVAAHAQFNAADPMASHVRMADRELAAREILAIRATQLDLVVFSACESAVSAAERAEEVMGLPRALLFAGAGSVLATLWKVPDVWAHHLVRRFYAAMRRGEPKAEALRRAALEVRAQDDRLDRWAGFTLVGSWL
ncbi:CHAT domain-containing protein [Nonomuraea sp. NPDC049400]|uniref:CHAT domain-containing protein n=1 Tax=Nonomuraea sp. NPDC049400 TaxID=3364352 RepID=UPI0037B809B8